MTKQAESQNTEPYVVLARKWRPQQFSDVVGQEPIMKTLQNAITTNRLAHAYLFCGVRGTGKTSTARLFAKALNCAKGLSTQPCDQCDSCKEIAAGTSMDVIEIDGASNRGIDQIRDLRDNVKFAPSAGRLKIYIIDEVHMLTTEAFNALLKTLEEPPAHVKFFFATTEAHKVPATILSRCQRFDLRRIAVSKIVEHLKKMTAQEKIQVEEAALYTLALQAEGSLRDAISLLDQMIAYCDHEIRNEHVVEALGLIQTDFFFELVQVILEKKGASIFEKIGELMASGKDLPLFLSGFLGHLRNLLLVKNLKNPSLILEVSQTELARLLEQANKVPEHDLTLFIDLVLKGLIDIRFALSKRVILEMCLLKMIQVQGSIPIAEAIAKIEQLEKEMGSHGQETLTLPAAHYEVRPQWKKAKNIESIDEFENEEGVSDEAFLQNTQKTSGIDRVKTIWPQVVTAVGQVKPLIRSYLAQGEVKEVTENKVILGFDEEYAFHREALETPQNKEVIEGQLEKRLGKRFQVEFISAETSLEKEKRSAPASSATQTKLLNEPLVKKTVELFGARVVQIKN